MDTVVYLICLLCLFHGYKCSSSNVTKKLVLSDRACSEVISDNTTWYEPVTYDDVYYKYEKEILGLLKNGQQVRLSKYGYIGNDVDFTGCFTLNEHSAYKARLNEIKEIIRGDKQQRPFQHCINSTSPWALISMASCVCVPVGDELREQELVKGVNHLRCSASGSQFISDKTSDIYMPAFKFFNSGRSFRHYILCAYIINGGVGFGAVKWFGQCGMSTDGTLCVTKEFINNTDCENIFIPRSLEDFFCLSKRALNSRCKAMNMNLNVCPEILPNPYLITRNLNLIYYFMVRNGHTVYSTDTIHVLYISDDLDNTSCVSLLREFNRLFVSTDHCGAEMKYLCRKISYNIETTISGEQTLHITLSTVVVCVFISLVTVAMVIVIRRRIRLNTGSRNIDSRNSNDDVELHSLSSAHDRSVSGPNVAVGAVQGPIGTDDCSTESDDSSTGPISDAGAVPGRIGSSSVANITSAGAVPGRMGSSSVANITTAGAVPGRMGSSSDADITTAGAVPGRMGSSTDADLPCAGEVPGRTRDGYNCYYTTDDDSDC